MDPAGYSVDSVEDVVTGEPTQPIKRRRLLKLPWIEVDLEIEREERSADVARDENPRIPLRRELLVLPFFVVVIMRLVGLIFFDWSALHDPWPLWYSMFFALGVACALVYAFLGRRDPGHGANG